MSLLMVFSGGRLASLSELSEIRLILFDPIVSTANGVSLGPRPFRLAYGVRGFRSWMYFGFLLVVDMTNGRRLGTQAAMIITFDSILVIV